MNDDVTLICPCCLSTEVVVQESQLWMVNTGEFYCHSYKSHDEDTKAICLRCGWEGQRKDLQEWK